MKPEFLLEIGSEEMPASMIARASQNLRELLEAELKAVGVLGGSAIETFATPRRLAAYCPRLLPAEPDRVTQLIGPPQAVAFDPAGKPTQAARSFAAKQGVRLESLKVVKTPKGNYVATMKHTRGRPTRRLLAEALPRIIPAIRFPRSMYWTSQRGLRFIRPIRWLLALYAGQVVEFELAGVRSERMTWGHRVLSGKRLTVRDFRDYQQKLRKARVLLRPSERAQKIRREQQRLIAAKRLRLPSAEAQDFLGEVPGFDDLLEYAVNSTEYPSVILGEFTANFARSLPQEVLITVMVHHQKYFSVRDRQGRLAPFFLAVVDREADRSGLIRRGHERVLEARFRDAEFFWETDQKRTLNDRLPELGNVLFESRLGSYRKKVDRMELLASWLGSRTGIDGRRADSLRRAVRLSKADLTTEMVREFPELQGVTGGLCARAQGEPESVAQAIYEHYKPLGPGDTVPQTLEGALLAIADRLDTIAACFSVGLSPTGSRDPFALRRAGSGVVRIILAHKLRYSLRGMVGRALNPLVDPGSAPAEHGSLVRSIVMFLEERARHLFQEVMVFPYDEVNAAFSAQRDDLVDLAARLEAIRRLRPTRNFEPIAVAFKRIRNILDQAGGSQNWLATPVDDNLMQAREEKELWTGFQELLPRVASLHGEHRYEEALKLIASLRPQVDCFFDKVLVMAKDEAIRKNRLALLANLLRQFSIVADFAEIVPRQPAGPGRQARGR